jgi:hypothetical protein
MLNEQVAKQIEDVDRDRGLHRGELWLSKV